MRYMIIVKMTEPSPPPSSELIAAMGRYNEELIKAGVLLAGEGLMPSSEGAKVKREGGKPVVRDGPFAEAKELVGGFWIIRADNLAEAVSWAKRIPLEEGDEVEVRRELAQRDRKVGGIHLPREHLLEALLGAA